MYLLVISEVSQYWSPNGEKPASPSFGFQCVKISIKPAVFLVNHYYDQCSCYLVFNTPFEPELRISYKMFKINRMLFPKSSVCTLFVKYCTQYCKDSFSAILESRDMCESGVLGRGGVPP